MKNNPLTLRVADDLAQALERLADSRGIPKSRLVREAIAYYLGADTTRSDKSPLLARDLVPVWDTLPHLTIDEAARFDTDLRQARAALAPPDDPWA